jgi:hypothetical protein
MELGVQHSLGGSYDEQLRIHEGEGLGGSGAFVGIKSLGGMSSLRDSKFFVLSSLGFGTSLFQVGKQ